MKKGVNFEVNEELYKKIKLKILIKNITLKQYMINLIEKDLEDFNFEVIKKMISCPSKDKLIILKINIKRI